MYGVLIEIDTSGVDTDAARKNLVDNVIPGVRKAGASAAYWLAGNSTRRVAVLIFDTEAAAAAHASTLTVGQTPAGAPEGITLSGVEVSEVIASL